MLFKQFYTSLVIGTEYNSAQSGFLGVSLDYLVGNSDQELDSNTLKRILEVQNLPEDIKEKIYYFIDVSIKDFKTRQAYS